jgi:hypothetical protein
MFDFVTVHQQAFKQVSAVPTSTVSDVSFVLPSYIPGLFLVLEGWIYFFLALLDVLSHSLPAARDSPMVFTVMDIVLGMSS